MVATGVRFDGPLPCCLDHRRHDTKMHAGLPGTLFMDNRPAHVRSVPRRSAEMLPRVPKTGTLAAPIAGRRDIGGAIIHP